VGGVVLDWTQLVIAVVGGGGVSAVVTWLATRPKTEADAAAVASQVAAQWIESQARRITSLEARIDVLEAESDDLRVWSWRAWQRLSVSARAAQGPPPGAGQQPRSSTAGGGGGGGAG